MTRSQILLVAGAAIAVVLVFLLPKVIINRDESAPLSTGSAAAPTAVADDHDPNHEGHEDHASPSGAADPHATVSGEQRKSINALRMQYEREPAKEEKLKLATQLASTYATVARHDSAGYYYEVVAQEQPSSKNFQKAGDQYFEAFSFAATPDRAKALGAKTREMYEVVLRNNPSNTDAKTNVAMTYIASEQPMQGIQMLREVIATDPRNEKALFNLGILSIQSNQYDKAVGHFRKLVEVNPRHVNGNFYLGVALAETGQNAEAAQVFRRVKELDQDPALLASVEEYLGRL